MYVYIKQGTTLKCVKDVTLLDGYLPVVGEVGKDLQLEPAIWFKTLIIDSILIDNEKRMIRWGKAKVTERHVQGHMARNHFDLSLPSEPDNIIDKLELQKSVFTDADCYDFDFEPDELFDTTRKLIDCNVQDKEADNHMKSEILRLLHCIVLPAVVFTIDDIPALQHAFQVIERLLKGIDAEIISKDKGVVLTENSLITQRNTILKNETFTSEAYLRKCNPMFLELLLKHIEKDIVVKGTQLENLQEVINKMKIKMQNTEEEIQSLSEMRKERDSLHDQFIKFQEVRETLKNVVVRPKRPPYVKQASKNVKPNVFHEIYMEITSRLTNEKEQIHRLCLRKVKISSVRESIKMAIEELESDGTSVGIQKLANSAGSVTDVGHGKPEEWLTLEEKISVLLDDSTSFPSKSHHKFCNRIIEKIKGRIDVENLFLSLNDCSTNDCRERSTSDGYVEIEASVMSVNATEDREGSDLSHTRHTHPFVSLVETIKHDILEHSQMMSNMLCEYIDLHQAEPKPKVIDSNVYNKVWNAYQLHFYYHCMKSIQELYEVAYKGISSNMYQQVKDLTFSEMGIDEPWLSSVLQGPVSITDSSHYTPSQQTQQDEDLTMVKQPLGVEPSDESVEHKKCPSTAGLSHLLGNLSLDDLYHMANCEADSISLSQFSVLSDPNVGVNDDSFCCLGQSPNQHTDMTDGMQPPSYSDICPEGKKAPPHRSISEVLENPEFPPPEYTEHSLDSKRPACNFKTVQEESLEILRGIVLEGSVLSKLKQITKCYRFIGNQVSCLKICTPSPEMVCCDELLSVLIVLLMQLDEITFQQLYAHMRLVIDLLPKFMVGSVHDCSLTNLHAAFQYISDRALMQQTRESAEIPA